MIDTVSILIPKEKVITTIKEGGVGWDLHSKTNEYEKFVRNPSGKDKEKGLYLPRLTGYRRKGIKDEKVKIEFSVPKLLFLNNLDEVEEKDFLEVVSTLKDRLETMGVFINKAILETAHVSSVHFSKNIPLEGGYTVQHIISEINKVNITKTFDVARTRFINEGQSIYAHTNSHEFVIYDKIADLNKETKKAIDKEQTLHQKSLFHRLNNKNKFNEVLRFEVRLTNRQKMKKLLANFGYTEDPTFQSVFKTNLSQQILTYYWRSLVADRDLGSFSLSINSKEALREIFISNPKTSPKHAIYMVGLFMMNRDGNGIRELRSILSKKSSARTWFRILKDIDNSNKIISKNIVREWVNQINSKLEEFKTYRVLLSK
ncbi:MAG TPA: hypothetical protein VGC58_02115 [Candidatus Paceibacterota bacterium]